MNRRTAFTYVEFMMVAVVAAILLVVALPDDEGAAGEQGRILTDRFEADVAYAQSLAIAQPGDPVVIKVDPVANRYWLAKASSPSVAIARPSPPYGPYIVQCGFGGDPGLDQVQIVGADFGGDLALGFDSTGSLDQNTPAVLQVKAGSAEYEMSMDPGTTSSNVCEGFTQMTQTGSVPLQQTGGAMGGMGGGLVQ